MPIWIIALRLCMAALLGGVVGIERENKKRAAGLRTHVLVSVGSALVMVTSEYIFDIYRGVTNLDPARLGAQVISGIGFLGAGTIIKQGVSVKGLTTAASLWAVACIGLAAGIGFYEAAVLAAAVVYLTLVLLRKLERVLMDNPSNSIELCVKIENKPGQLGEMASSIGKAGVNITNVEFVDEEEHELTVRFTLRVPKGQSKEEVLPRLKLLGQVNTDE